MATRYDDNEPFIVDRLFDVVYDETVIAFGPTNNKVARDLIFDIQERRKGGRSFPEVKSQLVLDAVPNKTLQSRYHSLITKYFTRLAKMSRKERRKGTTRRDESEWREITVLCKREYMDRAAETHEDIISPDGEDLNWAPEYEGPAEEEWT